MFELLEVINLFMWGGTTAFAINMVGATVGGHMVHQSVYEHQTTCHLPPFPPQSRYRPPHILQRNSIVVRPKVTLDMLHPPWEQGCIISPH
jgi:hypothetical protein